MESILQKCAFTLCIDLLETCHPDIQRLLLVPFDANFEELHNAIAAAFGWNKNGDDPCTFWHFQSLQHGSAPPGNCSHYDSNFAYFADPNAGYDIEPPLIHATTLVSSMFWNETVMEYKRNDSWLYFYNISRLAHTIKVMDVQEVTDRKIRCLGGTGSIERGAWQLMNFHLPFPRGDWSDADYDRDDKIDLAGEGSWDFNMAAVTTRMRAVQEAYEDRILHLRQPYVDRVALLRQQLQHLEASVEFAETLRDNINEVTVSPAKIQEKIQDCVNRGLREIELVDGALTHGV